MPNEPRRVVSPSAATDDFAARRMGVRDQHETEVGRARQGKTTDDLRGRSLVLPAQTIRFERGAIDTTVDGEDVLRLSDTSLISFSTTIRYPFGAAGRILGGVLVTGSARTAGTAAVRLRLSKGGGAETTHDVGDWVIDGATVDGHVRDQTAALLAPVANGLRFAKGDAVRASVVFTGYTPSGNDWLLDLVVVYEGLAG